MMLNTKFLQLITKVITILCLLLQGHICDGGFNNEAEALHEFQNGLKDPSNLLSSWTVGEDCCHWRGVGCNTTTGNQLDTFSNDSYQANPQLCDIPITKACPKNSSFEDAHCSHTEEEHKNDNNHGDKRKGIVINPFYITMIAGFFTGFWVFWGSILLFTSWRHAYFRFLSNMEDRIYVTVVVTFNKLHRKLHTQKPPQ
ncbi:unnamed protein product [Lathyrus sativus]|nr:unnamed protein product [Lathyrus sativus]